MTANDDHAACLCGVRDWEVAFTYHEPPEGEVRFAFNSAGPYLRRVLRCRACGHFVSRHAMDMSGLYQGHYVDSTYADGLRQAFDRIIGLPPERSDNQGRVAYVDDFARSRLPRRAEGDSGPTVLDVGSGLCVFLHLMKQRGWRCTALDPDPRAARHAREVVGVDAIAADFTQAPASGRFDLVCFNKVLEHVSDPAAMLARARHWLLPGGLVYVELPDGEAAAPDGPGREEFFIDHHHVFSPDSLAHLARRAGLGLLTWTRLREASGKYTLRAFLAPEASHA